METIEKKKMSILVPTDFSETCENAIRHAVLFSKSFDGSIYVLHVVDNDKSLKTAVENEPGSFFSDIESQALDLINALSQSYPDVNIIPVVRKGDIFTEINAVAVEFDVDIIILGTHGKKGFQKIAGSYALKVIDSTKVSVIVVQADAEMDGFNNIVFPVNITAEDRQKAESAILIARETGATIHLFPKVENITTNKTKLTNVLRQLKAFFDKYSVLSIIVENEATSGSFEDQIIKYSLKVNADLILILSDPSSHFPLLGNKEENLMFNSSLIPVMCVNERKFKSSKFSVVG
jgi:nucleotide-binding universal stress UspA family protein